MGYFSDSGGVAFTGDFDIIIMDNLWWVIAEHENFVSRVRDEEEISLFALVSVFLANMFDDTTWGLTSNHELEMLFAATSLERNNVIVMHLLDSKKVFGKRNIVFKATSVKVGDTEDAAAVFGGLFFVITTFCLDVVFVHAYIIT